jgi:hypothetical protein
LIILGYSWTLLELAGAFRRTDIDAVLAQVKEQEGENEVAMALIDRQCNPGH